MKFTLTVRRHYVPHEFKFDTLREAAQEAVGQLNLDMSFPHSIVDSHGRTIWEQDGPLSPMMDVLKKMALDIKEEERWVS